MSKKIFEGQVVSDKMQKTVVVAVDIPKNHPLYGKRIKNTRRFKAHVDEIETKPGDVVRIEECRPYSKEVTWKVVGVVGENK